MMHLEDYLQQHAAAFPHKTAIVCGNDSMTYLELWQQVVHESSRYSHLKNKAVIFRSSQDISFLVNYFAIHLAGAVAVPLESSVPEEKMKAISRMVQDQNFTGAADILFTTGTTGDQKGVVISHQTILANAENLIDAQGFHAENYFLICGPLNHIGSLSKIYPTLVTGGTLVILEGMKNMDAFYQAIDQAKGPVATFLVPATLRMLLAFSEKRLSDHGKQIEFIETGAAPMAHSDMLRLCQLLPDTRLYNTYASTETGIITTYNYNDGRCKEACLGKPMKHSRLLITDEGTIACQGPTLMMGYAADEERTRSVLHDNTVYTADLGEIDEDGMLHLLGRKGDVINIGGYKVAPTEVEDIALSYPGIDDCIYISAQHPVIGTVGKLLIVNQQQDVNVRDMAKFLRTKLESYKMPVYIEHTDHIERTYNGKLNRKYYQ